MRGETYRTLLQLQSRKCEVCERLFAPDKQGQWVCLQCQEAQRSMRLPVMPNVVLDYGAETIRQFRWKKRPPGRRSKAPQVQELTETIYVCPLCKRACKNMHSFRVHRGRVHHGSNVMPEVWGPETKKGE